MDSFEQLFAKAEIHGLIEQNIVSDKLSIAAKRQSLNLMREYDITQYCIEFKTYLNEKNNISFVANNDFSQYCHKESTFETFVEFIHYRKAETKKNIAQHAKKNAEIQRYNEQQLIAMDILGLTTGENNFNAVQPVFYYIDEVLIKHNLTPIQAAILLEAHTGGLTPTTNKSLTKKVIRHLKKLDKYGNQTPPPPNETKTDKLKAELKTYGFFELSMVKQLSEPNKQSLVELISKNGLPYSIAMIEYLGFLKHLKAEHFTTDYKLFKAVADWFKVAERAVKGNIYVLNINSKENKERYTADQHRQTVQNNYEKLK
jgi:hypothetical protein